MPETMTTKEVAKYLKLHKVTVNKYAAKGKIPAIRIGSVWRFEKEGIDKWISEGQKKVALKAKKVSTGDIDPNIIKKSRKGARGTTLKKKTEFKDDNQRPIIYKLRKQGKIKGERRGVYVEAWSINLVGLEPLEIFQYILNTSIKIGWLRLKFHASWIDEP